MNRRRPPRRTRLVALAAATALGLSACGSADEPADPVDAADWDAVLAEADGQSVNWHMFGGDDVLNTFVADEVAPRLAELGVTLNQVRIADTADAVARVLGEQQAGRTSGGAVDAIWINGENFATGVQADLWSCGWAGDLPNAQFVDAGDPAITTDFGVPVDGCESPWQQASSALVYDADDLGPADVESVDSLLAWVEANPGRFAYPAPPDFTGSMVVRTLLYGQIGGPDDLAGAFDEDAYAAATDDFWDRLNDLEPSLWRGGDSYPNRQEDVENLFASGEISAYFTYGPGAVGARVADGIFPASTRQAAPVPGNIGNVSFVTIPANAANRAAALVLADVLLDPEVQLALYRANGTYPAIDLDRLPADLRAEFDAVETGRSTLDLDELTAGLLPELAAGYLTRIESDWTALVQQQ
ncbi:putative ABC transporter solute-binding protein [Aeromicrobium marinum DSM 15272]|uniref:ABC transporter solute-binding protein n=1 Tax=Aeromicrobium marinum DSM 15272 TaxID=585531 RepID=E2SEY4_9ACTN|nr:ABC transporter substrate-binding protein [Aeromicrobium marinum]EFQ82228.1 putative ABC transporter solute-binding protein [Aeromicrobium marinum DSM 15272]